MNTNQFVAYGLIIAVFIGITGALLDNGQNSSLAYYTIAGLLLYVFGIWAAVKLLRTN